MQLLHNEDSPSFFTTLFLWNSDRGFVFWHLLHFFIVHPLPEC